MIWTKHPHGQVCFIVLLALFLSACGAKKEETPVTPPLTSPLSQAQIGFGVINVSYTRVNLKPEENSASPGYLRRGSVIKIIERRLIKNNEKTESWVLVEGAFRGWLKEILVDIYDSESQAQTAANSMGN